MDFNSVKTLTPREKQVADLLARGLSEKEVAERLNIKYNTVNNHTRSIRNKVGLNKNTEIILLFIADYNDKPFNIQDIRKYGVSIIL